MTRDELHAAIAKDLEMFRHGGAPPRDADAKTTRLAARSLGTAAFGFSWTVTML